MSWKDLENARPELAAFGAERFQRFGVTYLSTLRTDGAPRVHPVTPIVGQGRLFLFMEPTSPKGHDLRRDGRYALHCSVSDSTGDSGEFYIAGHAQFVDDPAVRVLATELAHIRPQIGMSYLSWGLKAPHLAYIRMVIRCANSGKLNAGKTTDSKA